MFNIKNVMNLLGTISNPNQAINMLLSKIPNQQAQMLRNMMNSGKSPKEAIIESAKNGSINLEQLNQAKSMFNMVRKLGYRKMNIPNEIWEEAEQLIKQGNCNSQISNVYTRF